MSLAVRRRTLRRHDHKRQGRDLLARGVHEPRDRAVVRLLPEDFDGAYDDRPAQAIAAA